MFSSFMDDLKALPVFAPLVAAVIAPISTLLDIPALTEPWFFQRDLTTGDTINLPDPHPNLALSGIGLVFNVLANLLLILRFSVSDGLWRYSTRASLLCWMAKLGIALGNILAYGILTRNTSGISYGEGFWCAVISLLFSLVIVVLLLIHYVQFVRGTKDHNPTDNQKRVRVAGRHFMLQNTLFAFTVGLLALFMSRVEGWTYFQGIYFSIVSILTVGFGDFYPTKPATQIVVFPFVLVGIVQIASIIDLLVRFFRGRLIDRHAERRREFEKRRQEKEEEIEDEPSFERELLFLKNLYNETNKAQMTQDVIINSLGFLGFWILGALIFSQIEKWTYGQGLYFCYVFFLTIGFGDYAPITPAGRVVFVVYSIVAVPIMASFAVQTIQGIFQKISADLLHRREARAGIGEGTVEDSTVGKAEEIASAEDEEKRLPQDVHDRLRNSTEQSEHMKSHSDILTEQRERIESRLSEHASSGRDRDEVDINGNAEVDAEKREEDRDREEDRILTEYVLELAVELEKHARRLLLGHMEEGSSARMLLKADRIVQLRNIKALAAREHPNEEVSEDAEDSSRARSLTATPGQGSRRAPVNAMMQKYYDEEAELVPFPSDLDEQESLEEIARYRESFAGLLAAGSRLLRLKDEEKYLFERQFWKETKAGD